MRLSYRRSPLISYLFALAWRLVCVALGNHPSIRPDACQLSLGWCVGWFNPAKHTNVFFKRCKRSWIKVFQELPDRCHVFLPRNTMQSWPRYFAFGENETNICWWIMFVRENQDTCSVVLCCALMLTGLDWRSCRFHLPHFVISWFVRMLPSALFLNWIVAFKNRLAVNIRKKKKKKKF